MEVKYLWVCSECGLINMQMSSCMLKTGYCEQCDAEVDFNVV